jgi:hypothetical protein
MVNFVQDAYIAKEHEAAMSVPEVTRILAVQSVITRVMHHIDRRRFSELRALFADSVETDYTSLFGGQVMQQSADDLVLGGWRTLLTPLDATQHILGPIDVTFDRSVAIAECHVRAYHRSAKAPGGPEWMVAGHYVFQLGDTAGGWKISKMKLETSYQTGNTKLLEEAAATR